LDFWIVSDALKTQIETALKTSQVWGGGGPPVLDVRGSPQEAADGEISLFLYHVEEDKPAESFFWHAEDPARQYTSELALARSQPLALNLFYLLSVSGTTALTSSRAQQAMGIAMRALHQTPMLRGDGAGRWRWQVTVNLEHRSDDEMSRLWEAIGEPLRLSAAYKVAVVLLRPDELPPPERTVTEVIAEVMPDASIGPAALYGTFRLVPDTFPLARPKPELRAPSTQSPAIVAPGQEVWLLGQALDDPLADTIFLYGPIAAGSKADPPLIPQNDWLALPPAPPTSARRQLRLKDDADLQPGLYELAVGHDAPISDRRPLLVAAQVQPTTLALDTAPWTIDGQGFDPERTEVLVGANTLTFTVSEDHRQLQDIPRPTIQLTSGIHEITIWVNGVRSDPAAWVVVP
jgi:hypothetical protein